MPNSLAKVWEKVRRLRKRFKKGSPWVVFPTSNKKEDDPEGHDSHPVSTAALALNVEAVHAIVEHYGPNPVHILPLQKQALHVVVLDYSWTTVLVAPDPIPGFSFLSTFPCTGGEAVRSSGGGSPELLVLQRGLGSQEACDFRMEEAA